MCSSDLGDYVEAMWKMLQEEEPQDFVIATGVTHSVRELVEFAFSLLDLRWEDYVTIDPKLVRPAEVDLLRGDWTKARERLGWRPKVGFQELVRMMVEADLDRLTSGRSSLAGLTAARSPLKNRT